MIIVERQSGLSITIPGFVIDKRPCRSSMHDNR
jgi:hypothetical protein